jgi:hypothetical protein
MQRTGLIDRSNRNDAIAFSDLSAADRLIIRTRNSEYLFEVVDPARRRGTLRGGQIGESPRAAVLVGVVRENDNGLNGDPSGLKLESQALFYIEASVGIERFVTSAITELAHLSSNRGRRHAA